MHRCVVSLNLLWITNATHRSQNNWKATEEVSSSKKEEEVKENKERQEEAEEEGNLLITIS